MSTVSGASPAPSESTRLFTGWETFGAGLLIVLMVQQVHWFLVMLSAASLVKYGAGPELRIPLAEFQEGGRGYLPLLGVNALLVLVPVLLGTRLRTRGALAYLGIVRPKSWVWFCGCLTLTALPLGWTGMRMQFLRAEQQRRRIKNWIYIHNLGDLREADWLEIPDGGRLSILRRVMGGTGLSDIYLRFACEDRDLQRIHHFFPEATIHCIAATASKP